ncbi:MAG: hypothetical protein OHK0046_41100 [Anaerolineae bacterium]
MGLLRTIGLFIWRFMVIFSFIVNIILVIVLLVLGVLIFEIKNQVAQPLVNGLHSSFVGLDNATIDWTIPVRDQIPVVLNIPLETNTIVTLTSAVPLEVNAFIDLPGLNAANVPATVRLDLPQGLQLPVALDLDVAVDQPLDVALDVRAVIPLEQTQLHDVAENLRLLFEPLARGLTNLPSDFGGAVDLVGDVIGGERPDLLAENDYSRNPWPGYSRTAGLGYTLADETVPVPNRPILTGIVPQGGIPFMDQEIREDIYDQGGPDEINAQQRAQLEAMGIPAFAYNGQTGEVLYGDQTAGLEPQAVQPSVIQTGDGTGSDPQNPSEDLGIITPEPGN